MIHYKTTLNILFRDVAKRWDVGFLGFVLLIVPVTGCDHPGGSSATSVTERLQHPHSPDHRPDSSPLQSASPVLPAPTQGSESPIARVNGQPIGSTRFEELLKESHGPLVLELLLSLERVRQYAQANQISITTDDIQNEYQRSIQEMARRAEINFNSASWEVVGEKLLAEFLQAKNISRAEYSVSMERNAYLRKLVDPNPPILEQEISGEFDRQFGRQAVVRHLVVGNIPTATGIQQQLQEGAAFAELARKHSLNRASGLQGGLLPQFSRADDLVPALLRETVFSMSPGQTSSIIKTGDTFQIVRVEYFIEPQTTMLNPTLLEQLRADIRDRKIRQAMLDLEKKIARESKVEILDPQLR